MKRFTLAILIIICALAGTWSVLDKHVFTAALYYGATVILYLKLEHETLD